MKLVDNDEMIKLIVENSQRSKSNSHRIDELAGSLVALNKMATALEVLATKQNATSETVREISEKLGALEARPMKRIRSLIGYILAAVTSAAAGVWFGFFA